MNKRIILVGPSASGKTYLRDIFEQRGFNCDVSYTTRPKREGEIHEIDYHFISEDEFSLRISEDAFYEHVQYNGYRYGTGTYEWNNKPLFIMETDGIKHITPEDRKNCFIIYCNPPRSERIARMKKRGWSDEVIHKRVQTDKAKFYEFDDYDIIIENATFGNMIFG